MLFWDNTPSGIEADAICLPLQEPLLMYNFKWFPPSQFNLLDKQRMG